MAMDSSDEDDHVFQLIQKELNVSGGIGEFRPDGVGRQILDVDCECCQKPIPPGQQSKWPKLGYKALDKPCFNALHCLERIWEKRPELKTPCLQLRQREPLKWQNIVFGLTTAERFGRRRSQLAEQIEFMELMVEEESETLLGKFIMFTKNQYVAWLIQNERMSEPKALAVWNNAKLDSAVKKKRRQSDGKLTCAMEMPIELHTAKTKRIVRQAQRNVVASGRQVSKFCAGVESKVRRPSASSSGPPALLDSSEEEEAIGVESHKLGKKRKFQSLGDLASDTESCPESPQPSPLKKGGARSDCSQPSRKHLGQRSQASSVSKSRSFPSTRPYTDPVERSTRAPDDDDCLDSSGSDEDVKSAARVDDTGIAKQNLEPQDDERQATKKLEAKPGKDLPALEKKFSGGDFHIWKKKVNKQMLAKVAKYLVAEDSQHGPLAMATKLHKAVQGQEDADEVDMMARLSVLKKTVEKVKELGIAAKKWKQDASVKIKYEECVAALTAFDAQLAEVEEGKATLKKIKAGMAADTAAENRVVRTNLAKRETPFRDTGVPPILATVFGQITGFESDASLVSFSDEVDVKSTCCVLSLEGEHDVERALKAFVAANKTLLDKKVVSLVNQMTADSAYVALSKAVSQDLLLPLASHFWGHCRRKRLACEAEGRWDEGEYMGVACASLAYLAYLV